MGEAAMTDDWVVEPDEQVERQELLADLRRLLVERGGELRLVVGVRVYLDGDTVRIGLDGGGDAGGAR